MNPKKDDNHIMNYLFPAVTLHKSFNESLEVRFIDDLITVYINGISIVSYSPTIKRHFGKEINLNYEDLQGILFLNKDFFIDLNPKKTMETKSDMQNLAKTFFKVNENNYVALIQYLAENGKSHEHYHSLDEYIIQLAGRSMLEIRYLYDDTIVELKELSPGDIIKIPSLTLHSIYTCEDMGGSITMPLKQTIKGKKDHLYVAKSKERILKEFQKILNEFHQSGREMQDVILNYYSELELTEKKEFSKIISSNNFGKYDSIITSFRTRKDYLITK